MSEHSGYPGAPPGWYQDPAGGPGQRWWDGYAWTEATVLPQHPPPPPPWAGAAAPQGPAPEVAPWAVASERLSTHTTTQRVDDERRMVPVARFAVAMPAVYFLVSLVLQRANADQLRSAGHQFRIDWHDAQNGITPPPYHAPSNSLTPVGLLVGAITVAAVIVACIWQHRAASAGRALGIPSRHSPAWGVGSWFVPVVNLWMPYAAVRDCLPPGPPAPAPGLALVDRLAPRRIPEHGGRRLRPVLDRDGPRPVRPRRARLPGRHRLGTRDRAGDRRLPPGGPGADRERNRVSKADRALTLSQGQDP